MSSPVIFGSPINLAYVGVYGLGAFCLSGGSIPSSGFLALYILRTLSSVISLTDTSIIALCSVIGIMLFGFDSCCLDSFGILV